jgi:hypothetical protein
MQHFKSNTFWKMLKSVCVCVHVWVRACAYVRARVHVCVCMCACVHACACVCVKSGMEMDHKNMYEFCIKYRLSINSHYVTDKFQWIWTCVRLIRPS